MVYGFLVLIPPIHPGVIHVDIRGIISFQDRTDHVVIVVDLRERQFHIRIILIETVKFGFKGLKVVVVAGDIDITAGRGFQGRLESLFRRLFLLCLAASGKPRNHQRREKHTHCFFH